MKHGFYFRFYKIFRNEAICCALSNLAYMLYCVIFIFKKAVRKKKVASMTPEKAKEIINNIYPRPKSEPVYINPEIREDLDLSIVIPVYNYAEILEKNIISVLNQKTKYSFEAIFVDDGSTDGARDILKKYENHPNVKLFFQENMGIGGARNTGINAASGKYLMFVDCDDTVHDDMVETLLDRAYKDKLDMVIAAHNLVKEKDGEVYEIVPNICPQKNLMAYKNGDEIMNYPGLPWAKVYRRELWNNVRFFPGYWYEDTIIQTLIFPQVKSYAYIPKVVYEYKWYEKNFSHTQSDSKKIRTIERYWLLIEILEKYESLGLNKDAMFYTSLLKHFSCYYYPFIKGLDESIVEALFVLAREEIIKYKPKEHRELPFVLRSTEKAFDTGDISLWQLSSCYQ